MSYRLAMQITQSINNCGSLEEEEEEEEEEQEEEEEEESLEAARSFSSLTFSPFNNSISFASR